LELFTIKNLLRLFLAEQYDAFQYFLPFVIWTVAIRHPFLSNQIRRHLLETAFWIFYRHLNNLLEGLGEGISENKHRSDVVYIASETALIRFCNTLLGVMVA
jgi:hypothetical protein